MKSTLDFIVRILVLILVIFLLFRGGIRIIGSVFTLFARFWYIAIPVLLVIWFYLRTRQKEKARKSRRDNLDPDKEVIVDQDKKD